MPKHNLLKLVGLAALIIFLVALPFLLREYYLSIIVGFLISLILVASFRLITTTGGWSLTHVPLMGLGAYTTAILTKTWGLPFWLTLPLAGLAAALVALIMSYPLSRIKGFAFFIASFALGEAMRQSWVRFRVPFRGHMGILNIPPPESILGIDFSNTTPYYFLVLVIAALCLAIMYRLERSRIVDTFKTIALEESLAKSVGINVTKYKILAFVIGGFFAGIAGVLFAHFYSVIDPISFGFTVTLSLLTWVVVGGSHTFLGPVLGLAGFTVVRELLQPLAEWVPLFYGIILILTILFLPHGLESLPKRLSPLVKKVKEVLLGSKTA